LCASSEALAEERPQNMKIKNYTSGVNAESTIARIEARLAAAGASGVTKTYNDHKEVAALIFEIQLGERNWRMRVPANVDACFEAMWKEHTLHHAKARDGTKERLREGALSSCQKGRIDYYRTQPGSVC
jgi:hypothetical protein